MTCCFIEQAAHRNNFTNICLHCSIHDPLHVDISNGFLRRGEPWTRKSQHQCKHQTHLYSALTAALLFRRWNSWFERTKHADPGIQMKNEDSRSLAALLTQWEHTCVIVINAQTPVWKPGYVRTNWACLSSDTQKNSKCEKKSWGRRVKKKKR